MTTEEKAKAYDEALEIAKKNYDVAQDLCNGSQIGVECFKNTLTNIFPELAESEDEKIRKGLIKGLSAMRDIHHHQTFSDDAININEALAWLEKQGKQKVSVADFKAKDWYVSKVDGKIRNIYYSVDKVEPKFKVGDFIVYDYCMGRVVEITNDAYLLDTEQGIPFSCEHNAHLWTIQDAIDGNVLINKSNDRECPFIFKETKPSNIKTDCLNPLTVLGYCGVGGAGFTKGSGWGDTANCIYYPATKKQRDTLFAKMKEAGYEWDAEKKELKKIHVIDDGKAEMDYCFTKMMTGEKASNTWSKEDEEIIESIEGALECYEGMVSEDWEREKYWLKSLKNRL